MNETLTCECCGDSAARHFSLTGSQREYALCASCSMWVYHMTSIGRYASYAEAIAARQSKLCPAPIAVAPVATHVDAWVDEVISQTPVVTLDEQIGIDALFDNLQDGVWSNFYRKRYGEMISAE